MWDVATKELVGHLVAHTDSILSMAFPSNSQILVTGSRDGTMKSWHTYYFKHRSLAQLIQPYPTSSNSIYSSAVQYSDVSQVRAETSERWRVGSKSVYAAIARQPCHVSGRIHGDAIHARRTTFNGPPWLENSAFDKHERSRYVSFCRTWLQACST